VVQLAAQQLLHRRRRALTVDSQAAWQLGWPLQLRQAVAALWFCLQVLWQADTAL
jgi:hypothetical protein